MSRSAPVVTLLAALLLSQGAVHARSSCSSDGVPAPAALLERFVDAGCEACWRDAATPAARPGDLPLDWIVPSALGDAAPLAAAARRDALARLEALGRPRPPTSDSIRSRKQVVRGKLRVAQGLAIGGYVGASIEWTGAPPSAWTGWLALVETLPAGTEGSPVARYLVRNVLQVTWPPGSPRQRESRPMNVPEGARPERLRVVGWVEDARGRVRAIAASACAPGGQQQ